MALQATLAWCRHHLLPLLTLAFMLGILTARHLSLQTGLLPFAKGFLPPSLALGVLVGLCLLTMLLLQPRHALVLAALPLFFCTGLLHGWQALQMPADQSRLARQIQERSKVTIHGRVLNMVESNHALSACTIEAHGLLRHGASGQVRGFEPVSGKIALRLRGQLPQELQPGTAVMALGWADRPKNRPDRGNANPALIYAAKGIDAILWLQSADSLIILSEPEPAFSQRLRFAAEQYRQKTARFLQQHVRPEVAGVYQALLIGTYQGVSEEQLEQFKNSGTLHILAISGLHLTLVGGMAAAVFYWLLKRSTWVLLHGHAPSLALLLTAPILFVYASLAGLNIPVLRALVSALLVLFALALRRQRVPIHLLAGAALLVLTLHPLALFTASFQLSFSAVAAIIMILPRLPWFKLQAATSRRRRMLAAAASLLLVSVAATIGTLPFMLYHFNRVSLIGPVMNLVVEPLLCLWALPLGLIAMVVLPMLPQLASALLQAGSLTIEWTLVLLKFAAQIPFATLWTITPHPLEVLLFLLIVVLFLQNWPGRNYWRLGAALLSFLLLISFTSSLWLNQRGSELQISFIDVGQGAATLVELPGGRRVLIDAGGYHLDGYDVGARTIAPFLWQRRIWRLDSVLVSHPDADHFSGMSFIMRHFAPQELIINTDAEKDAAYLRLLHQAQQQGVQVRPVAGREAVVDEPGLTLECHGVKPEENIASLSDNDRSLLVRIAFGKRVFLFPADIATPREQLLLQSHTAAQLRADLLLAGHHGSIGSTSPAFLDAVQPRVIVVSAGASRRGIHPAEEHLQLWQKKGIAVFSTASSGTIEVRTNGERLCLNSSSQNLCLD